MMRDCSNCHNGHAVCGNWQHMGKPDCPGWQPETNGDKVRQMTDEQLKALWIRTFPIRYSCEDPNECEYVDYICDSCPVTFYNWLKAEVEEGQG